jgi:hypothetical protein
VTKFGNVEATTRKGAFDLNRRCYKDISIYITKGLLLHTGCRKKIRGHACQRRVTLRSPVLKGVVCGLASDGGDRQVFLELVELGVSRAPEVINISEWVAGFGLRVTWLDQMYDSLL